MNESLAKAGVAAPWAAWFATWLPIVTGVLQLVLVVVGIGGGVAAWIYHHRKTTLLDRGRDDSQP